MAPNQPAQQIEIGNNAGLFQIRLQHRTGASEMTDYERMPMEMIDRNPLVFWRKNGDVSELTLKICKIYIYQFSVFHIWPSLHVDSLRFRLLLRRVKEHLKN